MTVQEELYYCVIIGEINVGESERGEAVREIPEPMEHVS